MKVIIPTDASRSYLNRLFEIALNYSYFHICEVFSEEKHYNRGKTDLSFIEVRNAILDAKYKHLCILHRKVVNINYDLEHWEFGLSSHEYYINIRVSPKMADEIFSMMGLEKVDS